MIKKILIANRGEIAVRIIRACRELGIASVSLHTKAERDLPHCYSADESYCLGEGGYLDGAGILQIARDCGAGAVHPGYGFLSESSSFARATREAGLIFIGPPPEAVEIMGDKKRSKELIRELGVPLTEEFTKETAAFPLLVKARAGGGGKGMRIVRRREELEESLATASREAAAAFGDGEVLLERYLENPRHIEVQVFSDGRGGHRHLHERECSIQRRYQKILEECPAPHLASSLRESLCQAALKIAKAVDYSGAGTVEFLLDEAGKFYFLEMNTRLQVEHPVTEMVTGLDLVALQIAVAGGEALPFSQQDVSSRGHAVEVRLCAEDPDNNFLPAGGTIARVGRPTHPMVRLDSGYGDGDAVGDSFDSLLAKLIAWGEDRQTALNRLHRALEEVPLVGIKTNRDYLVRLLDHPLVREGKVHTGFVSACAQDLARPPLSAEHKALAAAVFLRAEGEAPVFRGEGEDVWQKLRGFRSA